MSERRVIRDAAQFGMLIRAARREQGLSQAQLADWSGLHRTYISALENADRNPSLTNIIRLGDALGLDLVFERRGRGDA